MAQAGLISTASTLLDPLYGFFRWWRDALLDGLPAVARQWLVEKREELVVRVTDAGAMLERRYGDHVVSKTTLESPAAARTQLGRVKGARDARVVIEVPQEQALRRKLEWPLQAEANLRNAISYQLENLVPLPADAVYFDFVVRRRRPDVGLVEFELVTVPRDTADPWLDALSAEARLPCDVLTVTGVDGPLNLLPPDRRPAARNRRGLWVRLLAGLFVVLLAVALLLPIQQKKRELALLESEVAKFTSEAELVRSLRDEVGAEVAAVEEVVAQRGRMPSRLAVVEALARSLPDEAHLMALQIDGNEVKVTGEAPSSVKIVEQLSAAEEFAQVDFSASVTRSSRTGMERFQLKITLKEPTVAGDY